MDIEKNSKIKSAQSNLRIVEIQEKVEKYTGKQLPSVDSEIVAFVGPTKAGKSTLINCLAGNTLLCRADPALCSNYYEKSPETNGPEIGEAGESQTAAPQKWQKIPDTNFDMWDFPGFGDNKGTEQEISNAICYEAVLKPPKSVRFILVVPYELIISSDPMPFYKLLNDLLEMCPNVDQNLGIVVSKFERGNLEEIFKKIRRFTFSNANQSNTEIVSKGQKLINSILESKNYIEFPPPTIGEVGLRNKDKFIDMIRKLKGLKISGFPLVISDQAKKEILELYTEFYREVKEEVQQTIVLLENFFQASFDEVNQLPKVQSKYDVLKQTKKKISDILQASSDFEKFFKLIEKNGFGIVKFADCLEKFLFIEKLKNMYSLEKKNEKSDFFANITGVLENCLQKCNDLIKTVEASLRELEEQKRRSDQPSSSTSSTNAEDQKKIKELEDKIKDLETNKDSIIVQAAKLVESIFRPPQIPKMPNPTWDCKPPGPLGKDSWF